MDIPSFPGRRPDPTGPMRAARGLFPGYFALVMATGVVSVACDLLGLRLLALPLAGIAWGGYVSLWCLTLVRLVRYPRRLAFDLSSHQRAPGFFTIVAGTCVLGTQTVVATDAPSVGAVLWYLGLGLWGIVMYGFFTAVTIRRKKPPLAEGINGAWLIAAVATQSVVVLGAALNPANAPAEWVQLLCLAFFMIGCMLYLAIIPLIFYRLTFSPFAATDFGPPYWINMGAAAISTLAGGMLVARAATWPIVSEFTPFLNGLTVFFWSAASWWIPFLACLMAWRYVVRRDRLRYDPQLWGMVFPLGMYTTATLQMGAALHLPILVPVAQVSVLVALAVWGATFAGLSFHLLRAVTGPARNAVVRRR